MFFNAAAYKDGFLTYFYRLIFIWHRLCQKHNFLQSFACCKSLRDEINTRWKPRQPRTGNCPTRVTRTIFSVYQILQVFRDVC